MQGVACMCPVQDIKKLLTPIGSDSVSGSTSIALQAIDRVRRYIRRTDVHVNARLCRTIAGHLIAAQPSMGIILNLADGLGNLSYPADRKAAVQYLDRFEAAIGVNMQGIAHSVGRLLRNARLVMTYSLSSSVLAGLHEAYGQGSRFTVLVPESRPMNEGSRMMQALARSGIPVIYGTDAAALSTLASGDVDAVLIGADARLADGLVCKTGTRAIAELCRKTKTRLYGLCGTEKIVPRALIRKFVILNKPARELTTLQNKSVTVWNRYFEVVSVHLFTMIITGSD